MTPANFKNLTDVELLKQLIGMKESRRLYRGSLRPLFSQGEEGRAHAKCAVARELVRRWLEEELQTKCALGSPSAVKEYLKMHFAGQEHESFVTLYLDAQNGLIAAEEMFRGTLTQTSVYPREVVKAALKNNAASVVLAHNHPSGVAEPSMQDQALTRALAEALALVDVKVLNHFVVAGAYTVSFAERGLL